ncbi:carbohydrate-binding module family 48 protein [Karstenula rhodostoma CBS 690.94]|uniref:Carbohydrate-binding module family 48 protein n=1 Tax=Karstenula rhodostoma CBS 690.94 TaxID=1392251 RepID=A0A9P4U5Z0_9PLEO|nr:carbohydrate-binding module family 48 protein [Karstenula rhodostoma CBS 690.94]
MGKYTFTWEHEAHHVYVTGTFDHWQKTVQLDRQGPIFKKTVELPRAKHQYKFVVDGNWVTNESAPKEADASGIFNNVLTPEDIKDEEPVSTLSSAAPESSTAALAGAVPFQNRHLQTPANEDLPGAFPLTPPAETPSQEPQAFSINPIPASEGLGNPVTLAPGEKVPEPSTFTSNTVDSTVKHDKEPESEDATVSVAPIPATAGPGNPIRLAPGEKVPDASTLTGNTVSSTATTDAASYEKSYALPPQLATPVFTPETEREAQGGMFSLPPLAGSVVPESSLPMGVAAKVEQDTGIHIQSAAPTSTTAALAAAVPKEPRVPETVSESQKKAGFEPEASANAEAVEEKEELEQELKDKVPEAPATSTNEKTATQQATEAASAGADTAKQVGEVAAAGVVGAAGAFAAATYAAKDKAAETVGLNGQATTAASGVPEIVAESQKEAHFSPEAAANPEAVAEKKQVESELLSEIGNQTQTATAADAVPAVVAESQKAAHASPEASANPEAVAEKKQVESQLLSETLYGDHTSGEEPAREVPAVVAESLKEAHASPEAAANAEAVHEKKDVESELLQEVKKATESGEPAPTVTAATSATAPALSDEVLVDSKPLKSSSEPNALDAANLNAPASAPAQPATAEKVVDSRDVSPMSKQPTTNTQTEPVVTTGVQSSTAPAKSTPETPKKLSAPSNTNTPESVASGATDKKKKRRSFFGKLKDKFSSSK